MLDEADEETRTLLEQRRARLGASLNESQIACANVIAELDLIAPSDLRRLISHALAIVVNPESAGRYPEVRSELQVAMRHDLAKPDTVPILHRDA
jgi:hypothetical protein